MIPAFDYLRDYQQHRQEYLAACERVFESGQLILGEEVAAFEREFADQVRAGYAVGLNSGTDAISLALLALGVGPQDEVIVPAFTAPATGSAVVAAGAIPRFVDVAPKMLTIDVEAAERAISPRTRAVIAVHLYGGPAKVLDLLAMCQRRNLLLIEDCAQALGTVVGDQHVGTFGHVGCFSFYPTKNLGAFGDGGACVTNDSKIAARLKRQRQYGIDASGMVLDNGRNSRLDELQAALLRVKLPRVEDALSRRRAVAGEYRQRLADVDLELPPENPGHSYHQFVIRSQRRGAVTETLSKHQIGFGVHYPCPLHRMPGFARFGAAQQAMPEAERAANEVVSLPMFPELELQEVHKICTVLAQRFPARSHMASSMTT